MQGCGMAALKHTLLMDHVTKEINNIFGNCPQHCLYSARIMFCSSSEG